MLAKGNDAVPIPGTKRRTYLEENVAAVDIHLSRAEVTELEVAFPQGAVAGQRYAEANIKAIDRQECSHFRH